MGERERGCEGARGRVSLHGWLLAGYVGVWVSKECVERGVRASVVSNRENTCVSPSRRLRGPLGVGGRPHRHQPPNVLLFGLIFPRITNVSGSLVSFSSSAGLVQKVLMTS